MMELRSTFNLLLNNMTDGVMAHDYQRRIFYFNEAAQQITGYQYSDVIGKDCHEVFPGGFCDEQCQLSSDFNAVSGKSSFATKFERKDGTILDLELSSVAVKSQDEKNPGVMIIFRDLTEVKQLRKKAELDQGFLGIIGQAPSMQRIYHSIRNLADVNVPILIQGESGTGKEMVANALHKLSSRAINPFVPVNCGALPEGTLESELFGHVKGAFTTAIRDKKGRFELADGGTIFLDEVADIPLATQVKLLRVLQEKNFVPVGGEKNVHVDVRVICACNTNLKQLVDRGLFREDLYYRLAVVPLDLPPLRERNGDIPLLVQHYIDRFSSELGKQARIVSPEALEKMIHYPWDGNVRELSNVIHYATIQCPGTSLEIQHLPPEVRDYKHKTRKNKPGRPPKITSDDVTKTLEKTNGNQSEAAKLLGVNRATIYRIMRKSNMAHNA
jgi:PAS domain S-box-containing protein